MKGYELRRQLLSILYPNRCPFCGKFISSKEAFCSVCPDMLDYWNNDTVSIPNLSGFYAVYQYNDRSAKFIRQLKDTYDDFSIYAAAVLMNQKIKEQRLNTIDFIAYIPMTRNEYYRRGYNQAQKLAKAISKLSGIPIMNKPLKKIKKTEEQKKLNSSARLENIRGAFSVSPNTILKEKSVLLVDDVCTTGATLSEAASVLLKNGAEKVIAIVFAKTVKNSDKFS